MSRVPGQQKRPPRQTPARVERRAEEAVGGLVCRAGGEENRSRTVVEELRQRRRERRLIGLVIERKPGQTESRGPVGLPRREPFGKEPDDAARRVQPVLKYAGHRR